MYSATNELSGLRERLMEIGQRFSVSVDQMVCSFDSVLVKVREMTRSNWERDALLEELREFNARRYADRPHAVPPQPPPVSLALASEPRLRGFQPAAPIDRCSWQCRARVGVRSKRSLRRRIRPWER